MTTGSVTKPVVLTTVDCMSAAVNATNSSLVSSERCWDGNVWRTLFTAMLATLMSTTPTSGSPRSCVRCPGGLENAASVSMELRAITVTSSSSSASTGISPIDTSSAAVYFAGS
ncbi:hypothetical protein D3C71_1839580 [compost metagenome]